MKNENDIVKKHFLVNSNPNKSDLYTNNLKNWIFGFEKAPRLDDRR